MTPARRLTARAFPRLSGLTLSRRFALTSLVVFILLGVVLAFILGQSVQGIALSDARQTAYDDLHAQLLRRISPQDLINGRMTASRYRAFGAFIKGSIISDRTVRVKVWGRQGRVIYSNDPRIVGKTFPMEGELSEALHGNLASEVSDLSKSENRDDRRYGKLLEVYIPIQFQQGGPTYGAFEVYQTYTPVARQITMLQHSAYALIAGGLAILYLLLFGIVHHGSNTIIDQQRRLLKQALHDALTDLPNRTLLRDRLEQAISSAQSTGNSVALLLMDMDRFKEINDTFGHHYGDLLLQQFGPRLRSALRDSDMIARLGGDEFAIVLPATDEPAAIQAANRILRVLDDPYTIEGYNLDVGASIGIAISPQHGTEAHILLQRADVAMYYAKRTESGAAVYEAEHDGYSPERLALIRELRLAIESEHMVLHYQPKVNLKSRRVESVEALMRWQHPERGMIPPDQFIPLAEHTGLIRPLTRLALNLALGQCHQWHAAGLNLRVAVNISARSLYDSQLPSLIDSLLKTWNLPAEVLELELTETALMADPGRGAVILQQLQDMGISIAIDDYGSGYSSLAYLRQLPLDTIKIDKSFVRDMATDEADAFIVRSVTDLGHSLGLEVVAEGAENQQTVRLLTMMGCDVIQGYYLSRPLSPEALDSWFLDLRDRSATPPRTDHERVAVQRET